MAVRHDAPVLALAVRGTRVVTAGADGRVLEFTVTSAGLRLDRMLHESPKAPVTSLAWMGDDVVGAGRSLLVWSESGALAAKASLPATAIDVAVRGENVFVLAGGKLHRFSRSGKKLQASGVWKHGPGTGCELDVDDEGKRAVVVRDRTQVDLLDLSKKKIAAQWARKGRKVEGVSVRFAPGGNTLLSVTTDDYRMARLKDTTGRVTGEILWLDSSTNGPMVLDRERRAAAVTSTGEDVAVVEIDPARALFHLDPAITAAHEKWLASIKRIPSFEQIAPGFYVRKGSSTAPLAPSTQSAVAIAERGERVAAGFVSGEVVVADTRSGHVVSTHRGVLYQARCMARSPCEWIIAADRRTGDEVWFLGTDGRFQIADLAARELCEGPRVALGEDSSGELRIEDSALVYLTHERAVRWSKTDGAVLVERELPKNRGAVFRGSALLVLPEDSLDHDGFEIVSLDLESSSTTRVGRFVRDTARFPRGNDPKGWVAFGAVGAQPTLTIWAGKGLSIAQVFAFDPDTGTLGAELPWATKGDGRFLCELDGEIVVKDVQSGAIVHRRALEEGEGGGPIAYEPTSGVIAAAVDGSRVGVWDASGVRRLSLPGHRDMVAIWLDTKGRTALVRDRFWLRLWDIT